MSSPTTDLVMPKLGLTMTEGLLVEWQVGAGDPVNAGDVLFVVETDKVSIEIEAPGDGVIETILVGEGETVPTGTPLARWTGPGLADVVPDGPQPDVARPEQATAPSGGAPAHRTDVTGRIVATPHARRLAREYGVDLGQITGSGPRGRIKAEDVMCAVSSAGGTASAAEGRLVEPGSIRRTMAERMVQAVREVPHFYLCADVEVDAMLDLRARLNIDDPAGRITIGHFVVAAVARALVSQPDDNRIWESGRYRVLPSVDVGVAVDTKAGLLAPVLRGAATMGLTELAAAQRRLAARAREGTLAIDDMSGGAVTVSNLGAHGVGQVFPIINPPQSLILGVGATRPMLMQSQDGEIASRSILPIVLGADHRVFDGANAARILNRISHALTDPRGLLEH